MQEQGAVIERLTQAFLRLRDALDKDEAADILAASMDVRAAVDAVRAHGAWRADATVHEQLEQIVPLIEAARIRVAMASDQVRQKLAMLADRGGASSGAYARSTYGRGRAA